MSEVLLAAALRDTAYLIAGILGFAGGFHLLIRLLGWRYSEIMGKIDDNPLAVAVFLGLVVVALSSLVGAILH